MSDLRNLDLEATDYGLKVQSLCRNCVALTAGSANNNEYLGFYVNVAGAAWSFTPIDGVAAISLAPSANTYYNFHCSSITPGAGASGFGNLGGHRYNLANPISTFTGTGTFDVTDGLLTVAIGESFTLAAGHSVIPLIGAKYAYTIVVPTYTAATTFTVDYGGESLYDKDGEGTFSGTIVASTVDPLEIVIDTVATEDITISQILIQRYGT